jgi:hypothetical protein
VFDRFRHHARPAAHDEGADEHRAFIELLVLAMLADGRVSTEELRMLEHFDESHESWDELDFSVAQHLAPATSSIRSALQDREPEDVAAEIASRISSSALRGEARSACEAMLTRDGMSEREQRFLAGLEQALA